MASNKLIRVVAGFIVLISLWASIGSADPESVADTAPAESSDESSEESGDSESNDDSDDAEVVEVEEQEQFGLDFALASTNAEEMTELQFETWAADFAGTSIGWHATVERVEETLFDEIEFQVVVDPRDGAVLERAHLLVDRELALAIPQDEEIFFTGTIREMSNVIALTVDVVDVEIQDRSGNVFEPVSADESATNSEAQGDSSDYETWSTNSKEMTEAQFDAWVAPFIGTEFSWNGKVDRVEENLFEEGVFQVVVDIEGGSGIGERAYLLMSQEEALTANQNADISFTGTLQEADNLIALRLEFTDVTFTTS